MWWLSILLTWGLNHCMYFSSFSVLSDAAESLQQFRETVCYSGTQQRMNKLRSWAIFARGNLQGIPTNKNIRLEIYQDGCQQKYFISQSFTVLWVPLHFFANLFSTAGTSNKQVWDVLSFLTPFFWNSAVLWYFAFWSKDHKFVTGCHRGLCIRLQHKEKERIEVVSRPLVAMYLFQSDLQLRRDGLNDHGNSFSNFFSSGIGKECVSSAWIWGKPFLQHPKYDHPLKKTMCAKQHICGTFKSNQLLPQSWHCCTADQ